ncbi:ester cyclase [Foetidibacter luteolus]|uniref:ester cyclase n=1 Tax=Foetidibacter luteolus TaxID=2608880 RepID=UPI00129A6337|nr:ester cyclase [Foetidibacter luteolus]
MNPLDNIYRDYLECLNRQAWDELENFVCDQVCYNSQEIGLAGYRSMLEQNFRDIPDLYFKAELLVVNSSFVACRLAFDCSPLGMFMELPVNGRRVQFAENVFYEFKDNKIRKVWSVIDKASIEKQISLG